MTVRIAHAPEGCTTWYAVYRSTRPEWSTTPRAAERAALHGHTRFLEQLAVAGVCVMAGQLVDGGDEVVVLDGLQRREARTLVERDPWVSEGHVDVELVPMRLLLERAALEE